LFYSKAEGEIMRGWKIRMNQKQVGDREGKIGKCVSTKCVNESNGALRNKRER
jgi:hypothetical protein